MTRLPDALQPWREQLEGLPSGAIEGIAPHLGRLTALLGPLLHRAEPGGDEPDGLSGLTRRGPWERLLVTEWALAEVAPDEFLRRATSGEQLFRELAHRSPRGGRICQVLLDAGPDQLGQPRVVQLALLVVLARRAAAAGAALVWGPLQGRTLREGWHEGSVFQHFQDRSLADPVADDLVRPDHETEGVEHWIIGGPRAMQLPGAGVNRVAVGTSWAPGDPELTVEWTGPTGMRRTVVLPGLTAEATKRVFRRPGAAQAAPTVRSAHVGPVTATFRFSDEGTRLLAQSALGGLVAIKIHRAKRRHRPRWVDPGEGVVVAMGWHNQRQLWVSCDDGAYRLGGLPEAAPWRPVPAPDSSRIGTVVHYVASWLDKAQADWVCIVDGEGTGWRYRYRDNPAGPDRLPGRILALGRRSGVPLQVSRNGSSTQILSHPVRSASFEVVRTLPYPALAAWIGPATHLLRGGRITGMIAVQRSPTEVWVDGAGADTTLEVEPTDTVVGVSWTGNPGELLPVVLVTTPSHALVQVSPAGRIAVPGAVEVLHTAVSPGNEPLVAWMDAELDVVVYDLAADAPVLTFSAEEPPP